MIVGDVRQRRQRQKPRYYNEAVVQELVKLWELLNYSCGKRLVAIMPELDSREFCGGGHSPLSTGSELIAPAIQQPPMDIQFL